MGQLAHLLGGGGGSNFVAHDGNLAVGWLRMSGNGQDAEILTLVATDSRTSAVTRRVYELDTPAAPGAVTAPNVRVDISAGAGAAATVTALVAAINGDGLRVCDALDIGGDTVAMVALDPHVSIAATDTIANDVLTAAFVGNQAPIQRTRSFGRYTITAADVTTLAVVAGTNEIPIGGCFSNQATSPVLTKLERFSAAGGVRSPVTLDTRFARVNTTYWGLFIADPGIPLAAGDILSWEAESVIEA